MDILTHGDEMRIGLPKALLYYRYSELWKTFFNELGCDVVISGDTCRETLLAGAKNSVDENCLPLKIFMGHVQALIERCDYILVPRFARTGYNDEYCVRFWGLPDLVRNTFKEASLLSYNLNSGWRVTEPIEFVEMGKALGKGRATALCAYQAGLEAQRLHERRQVENQSKRYNTADPKILIAAQPYLIHDSYIGGMLQKLIVQHGGTVLFSDRYHRTQCQMLSKRLSESLYWTLNKEIVGAVEMCRDDVDGIILLTAFPCGTDSLVNELVMRKVKNVPLIQILLDEHTAPAGLETRIESFMDILQQGRSHVG